MRRIDVTMTDELYRAIESARGRGDRSTAIEQWLWRIRDIRLHIQGKPPTRKPRGRPRKPQPPELQ